MRLGEHRTRCGQAADQPEFEGLGSAESAAGKEQIEGAVASDDPRQMSKVDRRQQTDIDFGITKVGARVGHDHVARDRQRHAASARGAVDGGDRRLAQAILQIGKPRIEALKQRANAIGVVVGEGFQVEAGAESARHRAAENDGAHRVIGRGSLEAGKQFIKHRHAQGVDRAVVHENLGNAVNDAVAKEAQALCHRIGAEKEGTGRISSTIPIVSWSDRSLF